jgi:exosortase D (VPLPA-CTERM-specific)
MNKKLLAGLALFLACFAILYRNVIADLIHDWSINDNYSHGFLIVPIALYLAWERRGKFASAEARPSSLGLIVLIGSLIMLAVGILGVEFYVTRLSMLGVIAGSILFLWGWAHLRIMIFPIAFLLLMIPIPAIVFNPVAFPLQLLASRCGEWTLDLFQIPVLREGNVIQLANTTLEVAEACSGIRSLISLLTLGIVYGYFVESRTWARVVLALATVPVAIAANALRVAGTGLAAHYYGAEAAQGFFHSFSGWLIFLVAFAMLFVLHRVLLLIAPDRKSGAIAGARPETYSENAMTARIVIICACLLGGSAYIAWASRPEAIPPRDSLAALPMQLSGWRGRQAPDMTESVLAILGVDDYADRYYTGPRGALSLYVGYYKSQRQGSSIHSPLNCLPGAGWNPVKKEFLEVPVEGGSIEVNRIVILKGLNKQVVLYWYQSHGRAVASEYRAKVYTVLDAMKTGRTDAALVRVISPAESLEPGAEEAAGRRAIEFVQLLYPYLSRYVPD